MVLVIQCHGQVQPLNSSLWKVAMETGTMGPIEILLDLELKEETLNGRNASGSLELIRQLPHLHSHSTTLEHGLFAFQATRQGDHYQGNVLSPWSDGSIQLSIESDHIKGSIDAGMFAGSFQGQPISSKESIRDYPTLLTYFDRVVVEKLFNPDLLNHPSYKKFRKQFEPIVKQAWDDLDILFGFRFAWNHQPFSHFEIRRFPAPAEAIISSFDNYNVGYQAAHVSFEEDIAVLRVDTMMGNDTIQQIQEAYQEIKAKEPKALIIDLRGNGGGAFAVKPLVEHIISKPLDAGYFVSQKWNSRFDRMPTAQELENVDIWNSWSISAFWKNVQNQALLRLRFEPVEPSFEGPVYVLINNQSASATELAADAFRSSGRVTMIGEKSAGEMLSQSFFDLMDGFVISLPVADYYSVKHGRIEGVGVPVDVKVASEDALEKAKFLIQTANP